MSGYASNTFFIQAMATKLELIRLGDPRTARLPATPEDPTSDGSLDTGIGDEVLQKAHEAIERAEELFARGDHRTARELLDRTAASLREHAPSSGRPEDLMKLSHDVTDLIGYLDPAS